MTGLAASGLLAKRGASGDRGDLIVEAESDNANAESDDERWKWFRATATVTLRDGRDQKIFSRFKVSDRQASSNSAEARRRAFAELTKKAAEKTAAVIADFFQNQ